MGEFHEAVSTLLDAFARGISIIKAQSSRREKDRSSTRKAAETRLSKSLKKNRTDVKNTYSRDLNRFGPGFAAGDTESRSALSKILTRLTTGFLSIIERFSTGKSTPSDYQALLDLSDTTRSETINTFDRLSKRLSASSLVPAGTSKASTSRPRTRHHNGVERSAVKHSGHGRARSAPNLSTTPLGPATAAGWIRPRHTKKRTSSSSKSDSLPSSPNPKRPVRALPAPPLPQQAAKPTHHSQTPRRVPLQKQNRQSIMSFASDSTKLGEIPEHKWTTRPAVFESGDIGFPVTPYYPIKQWQEPVKQRSRFMRLFKRGD
ncbi:uncharacterized protein BP5553_00356 [Venustampulla echinocandica]|uniref:Uncharacterized protein n=1 Tax=Venustampulla echinocandica TaxID=2656787 RepID=A0A370TXY0_9HELO|nr:uncharacterized protein BP5553_00356 [Venustampulla echinocandica]RDL40377.1 hypothetical protein BP5553_00356 [Venustampulla echinocandica]